MIILFFREKNPPYSLDYTNPINSINYETINNLKNKELLISNENAHLLVEKNALEKNLKKHSLFINALSWKKFNAGKKKTDHIPIKSKVGKHYIIGNVQRWQCPIYNGTIKSFVWSKKWKILSFFWVFRQFLHCFLKARKVQVSFCSETANQYKQFKETKTLISISYLIRQSF